MKTKITRREKEIALKWLIEFSTVRKDREGFELAKKDLIKLRKQR